MDKTYIAIDLKSFYASVECVERGLDPLTTNLVIADESRTDKTVCLAITPPLKTYGLGGRARLFEVRQKVREVNALRRINAPYKRFSGKSANDTELKQHPELEVDFLIATPRMKYYIEYSQRIHKIYLKYISPDDIHVYSIDEIFFDATHYLATYKITAHELAMKMIQQVLKETGITATAGIGSNLYLAKVAMDIVAKHVPADKDGVRIAELDEMSYRQQLWSHTPITAFWRVGRGTAKRLAQCGVNTMGQLARLSLNNEDLLYKLFGVNAELLIDHAWGYEPCTIADIKNYHSSTNSFSSGQVLHCPYEAPKAKVVLKEMADEMALKLVSKKLVTNQLTLYIGYDAENMSPDCHYQGELHKDHYGRMVPKAAHGSCNLTEYTSSSIMITKEIIQIFDRIINPNLTIRRLNLTVGNVISEEEAGVMLQHRAQQIDLFTDLDQLQTQQKVATEERKKERRVQETLLDIKQRFGKNAILKGTDFSEGATMRERNQQIGGHKA